MTHRIIIAVLASATTTAVYDHRWFVVGVGVILLCIFISMREEFDL